MAYNLICIGSDTYYFQADFLVFLYLHGLLTRISGTVRVPELCIYDLVFVLIARGIRYGLEAKIVRYLLYRDLSACGHSDEKTVHAYVIRNEYF